MNALISDLRFAIRVLAQKPGFRCRHRVVPGDRHRGQHHHFQRRQRHAATPFPFADPDRIVAVHETQPKMTSTAPACPSSTTGTSGADHCSHNAAYAGRSITFSGSAEPERVAEKRSPPISFRSSASSRPWGGIFVADEDQPGAPHVVLLSDAIWRRRFNRDPPSSAKSIMVNAAAHTVVGVMPPRFQFPRTPSPGFQ